MKNIKIILITIFGGFLFVSCDSATTQDLSPIVIAPKYTANVKPVFSANCTGCHSGGSQLPDLDSYTAVKDATLNGNVVCKISGSCGAIMPPSGALPQATINLIKTWKSNGCPE